MRRIRIVLALVLMAAGWQIASPAAAFAHSATDVDGDGRANTNDNCIEVYNKTSGTQLDNDLDGIGDHCDETPYRPDPDGRLMGVSFYFLDAAREPHPGPVCMTFKFTSNGVPDSSGSHSCPSNGGMFGGFVYQGNNRTEVRGFMITCDAGGVRAGTFLVNGHLSFPLSPTCDPMEPYVWGGLSSAVAARFAPLLRFHPDEQWMPMDQAEFIEHSALRWSHDVPCKEDHTLDDIGEVDAAHLGAGHYSHKQTELSLTGCIHTGRPYRSDEYTRPHDSDKDNDQSNEGFYLDLDDDWRDGSGGAAWSPPRLHYSFERGRFITYWFFYGFNKPGVAGIGEADEHEGEWERISVRLTPSGEPVAVAYYQHFCEPEIYSWEEMLDRGWVDGETHPIVFSAHGSHASYPEEGIKPHPCENADFFSLENMPAFDVVDGSGVVWPTWLGDRLRDASAQPWYGFGGAWGNNGHFSWTTGPLGPPHKSDLGPNGWEEEAFDGPGWDPLPEGAVYIALGDSFSSGEGVEPFDPETDQGSAPFQYENRCHRSRGAYARIFTDRLNAQTPGHVTTLLRACSGAEIAEVLGPGEYVGEPPQATWLANDDLVSISIGGNDAGFGHVLDYCVKHFSCEEHFTEGGDYVSGRIKAMGPRLVEVYREIRRRAGDGARFVIVGYPHLFPEGLDESCWFIDPAEASWFRDKATELNSAIRAAVAEADVDAYFLDVEHTFDGHELCSGDPWVNRLTGWPNIEYSFHPNAAGQAAIADALALAVRS